MYLLVDLFAGVGGIRKGFELARPEQTKCVFTSEWDKHANETYKENYPNELLNGDITAVHEQDIPHHNILMAGFPCQPFSIAGHRKGFEETRGTLFFDILRIVKEKQPDVVFLENVKHLKNHDSGRTLDTILKSLKDVGYRNIHYQVLNARDFGVPQNRERIFIVAFKNRNISFTFPNPPCTPTRAGDILDTNPDGKYTLSDRLWAGHQRRKANGVIKGTGFGYGMVNADTPYTKTITARYYKDGSEILIEQQGKNPRKLTPREAARLNGFPEDFKLPTHVSDSQLYKQFGNTVCVTVVKAIAEQVFNALENKQPPLWLWA